MAVFPFVNYSLPGGDAGELYREGALRLGRRGVSVYTLNTEELEDSYYAGEVGRARRKILHDVAKRMGLVYPEPKSRFQRIVEEEII